MKKYFFLFLVLVFSNAAMAESGKSRFMSNFDANNDGKVTKAEFDKAAAKKFKDADASGDGKLTFEEFLAFKKAKHFAHMDTNKDGKISKQEFIDYKTAKAERKFARKDKNNDGFITRDEMMSMHDKACPHHMGHDKHHGKHPGGHHGMWEMRAHHKFMRMDENNDGVVTRAEKQKFMSEKFKKMDANNDKVVTQDEVEAYRKKHREEKCKK